MTRTFAKPMNSGILLSVAFLLVVWPSPGRAQLTLAESPGTAFAESYQQGPTDTQELEAFLDAFFAEWMDKLHVPGAVISVVKDGQLFFAKGYGFANVEHKTSVIPDKTLFDVASVTKLFTATAVMQLYERGLLNLDDDVNEYLKGFRIQDRYSRPVTVTHLLTHTGGFDDRYVGMYARRESDVIPLGQYLAARMPPRVMPQGEVISYSNHGMALAGYLVEVVSGIPFAQYVEENILKPLGMERSGFRLSPHLTSDLATGYDYDGGVYRPQPINYMHNVPAGALKATATDMARFMIAHLQGGRYGDSRILEEKTLRLMNRQRFTHHPRLPGVAYGFFEHFENNLRALKHEGSHFGFRSLLFLLPEQHVGFFVAYNGQSSKLQHELVRQFLDHYYPVQGELAPSEPPTDLQSSASRLTGSYRYNRYARHSFLKLTTQGPALLSEFRVKANDDGTLSVSQYFGRSIRLVGVEPLLFQGIDDERYLGFREDEKGHITHMFIEEKAFDRLSWYETANFHLGLIGLFVVAFLSPIVIWPAGYLVFHLRRRPSRTVMPARLARLLAGAVSTLILAFLLGLVMGFFLIGRDILYGMPATVISLLVIPLVTTGLTGGLLVFTILAWRNKYWSLIGRVHYSVITLAGLAFIWFLLYWNLLGFRY